jgi:hypothetical protein
MKHAMKQATLSLALALAVGACSADKTAAITANDLALSSPRVSEDAKLPSSTAQEEPPACAGFGTPCRLLFFDRCCPGRCCHYHICGWCP